MAGGSGKRRERRRRFRRRTAPGAPPGSLVVDPEAGPSRLHVIAYGPDGVHEGPIASAGEIRQLLARWPVTWVNVDGLGDAGAIQMLGEVFGLHQLSLEDVVNVHQRPKFERYDAYDFVVVRTVEAREGVHTEQVSVFLGTSFVVTFQERAGDAWDPVRQRLRQGLGRLRHAGPDYLAYALIDAAIDAYFPVLEWFGEQLDGLEDEALRAGSRHTSAHVHAVKRDLLVLRRALWPLRDALGGLLREDTPRIRPETRIYLRDGYDHTVQLLDLVETYREVGASLTDVLLSSTSNRLNEVMKVLTIIATIFIPLTFISGLYGMNFHGERSPWNMPELDWYYGYPFALGLMVIVTLAMLLYFYRKGWMSAAPAVTERPGSRDVGGETGPSKGAAATPDPRP